jgi:hypothetical protein
MSLLHNVHTPSTHKEGMLMEIQVTVCDIDRKVGEPTKQYTISVDGKSITRDLCAEHAAPLEALLSGQEPVEKPKPAPRRSASSTGAKKRGPRAKVVSLDEIEKMKSS